MSSIGRCPSRYAWVSSATRLVPSKSATCPNSHICFILHRHLPARMPRLQDVAHHDMLQHRCHLLHRDSANQGNILRFESARNPLHCLSMNLGQNRSSHPHPFCNKGSLQRRKRNKERYIQKVLQAKPRYQIFQQRRESRELAEAKSTLPRQGNHVWTSGI